MIRLGVNIDHVATIRNARGGTHPDPIEAAKLAAKAGADGITAHLREDRRHISDNDIERLAKEIDLPLNLEMAATDEMLQIALKHSPHACCIVPEKREEKTTEGGLDVAIDHHKLKPMIAALKEKNIRVSLFIDPDFVQIAVAKALGADIVELHTGSYADAVYKNNLEKAENEYQRLYNAAIESHKASLEVHAGHGLNYEMAIKIAKIPHIQELNIGHFLIGQAIFDGLENVIKKMKSCIVK